MTQPTTTLPPARSAGTYRIALICLGNICRSPMADIVLSSRVADAGLATSVTVVSAGTGDWHVGKPIDQRAGVLLTHEGYDASRHRAQQVPPHWLTEQDLTLAMDAANLGDLRALGPVEDGRLRLFRDFDPVGTGDVPDPYFGGDEGFVDVLAMVERTAEAIVAQLGDRLGSVVSH